MTNQTKRMFTISGYQIICEPTRVGVEVSLSVGSIFFNFLNDTIDTDVDLRDVNTDYLLGAILGHFDEPNLYSMKKNLLKCSEYLLHN